MDKRINHLASPGPGYWDFRCLICDGLVRDHPGLLRMMWRVLSGAFWDYRRETKD